jgi:hypothetical protein
VRSAGQALGLGLDELEAAEAFNEQELLERMRTAVSCHPSQRMRQQQRRLSAFSTLPIDPAAAAGLAQEQLAASGLGEDGVVTDSAYEEELGSNLMRQISQEMDEVLQAIDTLQKQDARAAMLTIAEVQQGVGLGALYPAEAWGAAEDEDYDGAQSDYQSDAHTSRTPYTDVWDVDEEGERVQSASWAAHGVVLLPLGSLHVH